MIVADANLLIHLVLPGPGSEAAAAVHERDSVWLVPPIALSEIRNVLVTLRRAKRLTRAQAHAAYGRLIELLTGAVRPVDGRAVLEIADKHGCSAYDAEYAALAIELDVGLVTSDQALIKSFPATCVRPQDFLT